MHCKNKKYMVRWHKALETIKTFSTKHQVFYNLTSIPADPSDEAVSSFSEFFSVSASASSTTMEVDSVFTYPRRDNVSPKNISKFCF